LTKRSIAWWFGTRATGYSQWKSGILLRGEAPKAGRRGMGTRKVAGGEPEGDTIGPGFCPARKKPQQARKWRREDTGKTRIKEVVHSKSKKHTLSDGYSGRARRKSEMYLGSQNIAGKKLHGQREGYLCWQVMKNFGKIEFRKSAEDP